MASAYCNTDSEDEINSPNNSIMDLNESAQEIYDKLMRDILMIPIPIPTQNDRQPTMPIERQQQIVVNQQTVSTRQWADMTDDEMSPEEMSEALDLDHLFPISDPCLL